MTPNYESDIEAAKDHGDIDWFAEELQNTRDERDRLIAKLARTENPDKIAHLMNGINGEVLTWDEKTKQ